MSAADERAAMVALLRTGRRPWVQYAELVEELGSAIQALQQERAAQLEPHGQASLLAAAPASGHEPDDLITQAKADLERWNAEGMRLVTVLDPDYPPNLKAVHNRPPMVFLAGRLTPDDARAVAVVGARKASDAGLQKATQIAQHLVDNDYTVVSGLAVGIDTAAHTTALRRDGRTVAVVGTGLSRSYPPQNQALQREIAERCVVVSQFWPDAPPTKRSFPMRNAVMSGLALASVVVEASETSGARIQARLALAQGRPVFLLHELVERQPWAQQAAQRPGTHVVRNPVEITKALERLISRGTLVA
ncbi:MAG: DNA-protecting protein DprA [Solirubrobacterales bacterium]|nr:DNA-protecting protein DprA [Solirubrobacterales bacterium]